MKKAVALAPLDAEAKLFDRNDSMIVWEVWTMFQDDEKGICRPAAKRSAFAIAPLAFGARQMGSVYLHVDHDRIATRRLSGSTTIGENETILRHGVAGHIDVFKMKVATKAVDVTVADCLEPVREPHKVDVKRKAKP